ncbi:MAG TPA: aliphatic sulfonate ABC transporter substrate-binding protein [Promicromonospora sp.]|nr:aliphatic sulfonate ABC transporter substrate-binding protein [Promicromonospora sp.]
MSRATRTTALAGVAVLALSLAACSSDSGSGGDAPAPDELTPVSVGYIADFNGASLVAIADEQGLFAEHGLDVELAEFTNGPLQVQALGTADLDFGYLGPGALWLPATGQAQVVAINATGNADRVLAHPDSGVTSLEDLAGKKIAIAEGTSGDMIVSMALKSVGLTTDDVELVPMDPSTIVSAFASGQVDAAGLWYPLVDTVVAQVPDTLVLAENADFVDEVSFPSAVVARNEVVAEQPETVEAFVAALREANDFRHENLDEAVQITADRLGVDSGAATSDAQNATYYTSAELDALTEDGTVVTWLTSLNEYFVDTGKAESTTDPAEYYQGDLYVAAGSGD